MYKSKFSTSQRVKRMVTVALFCALAYAAMLIFRINVSFLTFDVKDAIITICGLTFGPISAVVSSLLVSVLELVTISDTGFYGFLMNFISSATFSFVVAIIYKYKKNIIGAVIGIITAVFSLTAVMIAFNLFITPLYMGVDRSTVVGMIPTLLLPFNFTKAIFNGAIVLLLYKPVSVALKATKLIARSENSQSKEKSKIVVWQSLVSFALGAFMIALSIIMLVNLNGKISWF